MNKIAMITGITGQDGSYLLSSLLSRGYHVVGLYRRNSTDNFWRIQKFLSNKMLTLEEFDLTDYSSINRIVNKYNPNEFYNLAAQSHVATSFSQPINTFNINTNGVVSILEIIRSDSPKTRFYQASTSEMFGSNFSISSDRRKYQNELTNFSPQSPYAISKVSSHEMVRLYRESYGIYCCSGILFNHESPKRGENFVTRKITKYLGRLVNGLTSDKLKLGNINTYRDWGHAKDYVEAMRMMLNQPEPDDYIISTGETHSVKEFLKLAFDCVNLNYEDYIEIDPSLYRPAEVDFLLGDCSKAKRKLGWSPSINFEKLVSEMVESDIKYYEKRL